MRVLLGWLREMVELPEGGDEVARRLTMAGLEAEGIERLDEGLQNVVVGQVRSRQPVEGTKLSVCRVFDGVEELQIVCGAQNYSEGDHVPLARVGAVLPGNKAITAAKVRGIDSFGMLCSSRELGLGEGDEGLLILPPDTVPGTAVAKVVGRDDVALELNVTPNRADALSHLGIARDLGALYGRPVEVPEPNVGGEGPSPASAEIAAPELCARFCVRVIEGVRVGPSPQWLVRRLEALGQRSVNNVVDATNYVLFELGQPLHAYDLDRVAAGKLIARRAGQGELLRTLDGKDRVLSTEDLVIADAARPVAIAGVMGGADSEVSAATTRLLLESAWFEPSSVRRSARRHGIHSEASHRFERGVDPEGTRRALDRLAEVILEIAGGELVGEAVDVVARPHARARVSLRRAWLERVLGPTPWDEAAGILRRLGLKTLELTAETASFEVPGSRLDIANEEDLVEEVARIRGFEAIVARRPHGANAGDSVVLERQQAERRLRAALSGAGFDEAMNFAFADLEDLRKVSPDLEPIRLRNPLAQDQAALRTTLLPGLLHNLAYNLRHGAASVRLYELGRVYLPLAARPDVKEGSAEFQVTHEPRRLGLIGTGVRSRGWAGGKDAFDFHDIKGALETALEGLRLTDVVFEREVPGWLHPRAAARVRAGNVVLGHVGELHPTLAEAFDLPRGVFVAELDADASLALARLVPSYGGMARFPATLRDVAVVVDDQVAASEVLAEIREASTSGLLEEALVFDVYKGAPLPEGKKNLAFSLRFRAPDRTLTDDEVERLRQDIVSRLGHRFRATLRA